MGMLEYIVWIVGGVAAFGLYATIMKMLKPIFGGI